MTQETGWGIFGDQRHPNIFHIYPVDEKHDTIIGSGALPPPLSDCKCMPKTQWNEEQRTWLIIHGAFDGREAIEETLQILKNQ